MKMTREQLTRVVREAARLQRAGRFIDSIKYLRNETGSGLMEGKHAADKLRDWIGRNR